MSAIVTNKSDQEHFCLVNKFVQTRSEAFFQYTLIFIHFYMIAIIWS